jgi:hypothetical protein
MKRLDLRWACEGRKDDVAQRRDRETVPLGKTRK